MFLLHVVVSSCLPESWQHIDIVFNELFLDPFSLLIDLLLPTLRLLIVRGLMFDILLIELSQCWEVLRERILALFYIFDDFKFPLESRVVNCRLLIHSHASRYILDFAGG